MPLFPDIVKALVERGADVNVNVNSNGAPPLHLAIEHKNVELVKFLLSKGADPTGSYQAGGVRRSPMISAKLEGLDEVVGLLKEAGAQW